MSPRAAALLESYGFTDVYDYVTGKADWLAHGLPSEGKAARQTTLGDVARRDVPTAQVDEPADELQQRLRSSGEQECVVLDPASNIVIGLVRLGDFDGSDGQRVEDVMAPGPSTWRPDAALDAPLGYMDRHDVDTVLVTTSRGALIGLVDRSALEGR